jgi:hypothetical protein
MSRTARAALSLLFHVGLALLAALALAVIWTLARGGQFSHTFVVGCYVIGALLLLFGAFGAGGMSPSSGAVQTYGRLPGVRSFQLASPGPNSLRIEAVLFITGLAMILIGIVLHAL